MNPNYDRLMYMKAVFLDRDGVINVNRSDFVKSVEDCELLEGACEAIADLSRAGWPVFIISNQACVGRGHLAEETLNEITEHILMHIEQAGGKISNVYYCKHHPDDGCDCRKPLPGLLHQAIADHTINVKESWMVGDTYTDIIAGQKAGSKTILVLSGRGEKEIVRCHEHNVLPDYIVPDLKTATLTILSDQSYT